MSSNMDEETIRQLVRDELERQVRDGGVSRRDMLAGLGMLGGGALLGGGAASQAIQPASAATGESGTIGTASSPVDVEAQDINAVALHTEQLSGAVAGNDTITNLAGTNLSIDSNGNLNASGGGTSVDVEDDGTTVVSGASAINMATNLIVSDDGDGTVTVDGPSATGVQSDDVGRIDVQSTAPSSPSTGDLWVDTS